MMVIMVVSMMVVVVMLKTIKETSDTDVSTYILTQLHMCYHVCFMREKGKGLCHPPKM